ncbi:hypothetical protein PVL29_006632 [Vitis rotundifolia]|uniref:Disease resistance protein winged helix domain-containing protein n=1 Tax=Vitis rotundifolia TaxID=103349 RepID=A0AA39DZ47_VITRO|nr:hypothetical protein PVL29_006632 [Vitis rotundifolia]
MKFLDWDSLRIPLLASAQGSKIVVTTRDETLTKWVHPEDCWSLFTKLAFQNGNSRAYHELEPIGRRIVEKCRGLPLAVKLLGSLLRSSAETRDWEEILRSKIWDLPSDFKILPSLMLSYHHLSLPLKRCFAYCSIFPKNHEFDKQKLILLWMAEGLLQLSQCNKREEEVGDLYFNELVDKSFFQESIRQEACFVMHDLIHDLAQHMSLEFCVQFEDAKVETIYEKARHFLYFKKGLNELVAFETIEAITKAKYLRSFLEVKPLRRGAE